MDYAVITDEGTEYFATLALARDYANDIETVLGRRSRIYIYHLIESRKGEVDGREVLDYVTTRHDGWQSLATVPRDGSWVLTYRAGIISQSRWQQDMFGEWVLGGKGWSYPAWDPPTHWRSMPAPPEGESDAP